MERKTLAARAAAPIGAGGAEERPEPLPRESQSPDRRPAAALLALLFAHPGFGFREEVRAAAGALGTPWPIAARALEAFLEETSGRDLPTLRQLHAHTFDLSPHCAPYLGVHLFGDGSFRRARLLAGLEEAYERTGFDRGGELSDHLAVVLRFAPRASGEEWEELVQYCLIPAATAMRGALERLGNPYRHLLEAVAEVVGARPAEEPADA